VLITQHLENDRLFKDYIINRRFEMELDIASYIQMRLFPKKAPPKSKLLISFYNRPFLKVTGDYFDFIELDKHNTALVIGDVSGHGLGAAMILTMTNSIMHGMLRENKPIESAIEEINHFLNYSYQGTELITLFAGVYNNITRELTYINAGHCAPVHITKNRKSFYPLAGRSKIIGADPNANYFPSKLTLEKDDELIFYTDGIIEIYDEKTDHEFNEKSLYDIIAKNLDADIERKIHEIVEHISKFNHTIKDDITIIAVKIT
jgi:sigma-B regulation protein RsbU (phosphoserine phosphatase)